ncbi:unnamed protein product, partial [Prorocentrum cordatum]
GGSGRGPGGRRRNSRAAPRGEGLPAGAGVAGDPAAEPPALREGKEEGGVGEGGAAAWLHVDRWMSPEALVREEGGRFAEEDFLDFVPCFWRRQLARADRAEAARLARQLGGDDRLGWLRSAATDRPSELYQRCLRWKAEQPEHVLLVQVGDFFESWGVDAVMLVQWCGLAPMARRPRAGFPASASTLQQVLNGLTEAGLGAAVYVQTGAPGQQRQPRELRQVVTPGAPTYLFGSSLKRTGDQGFAEFSEGRPYVALRLRADGYFYAELRPYRREVRFCENVAPEGVESLLAENDGVAWPVLVDGPAGQAPRQVDQLQGLPKQRKWLGLPADVSDEQFLDRCCQVLSAELHLAQEPAFQLVRLDGGGALQPLSLTTARNLGVLPRDGVPNLVSHILPKDAPAAARHFFGRWLLAPRGEAAVAAMRELLRAVAGSSAPALPPLLRVPSVAKVMAYVTAQTAPERLFRDLRGCCRDVLAVLRGGAGFERLLGPLLLLAALDTGCGGLQRQDFEGGLRHVLDLVDARLQQDGECDDASTTGEGEVVSEDPGAQRAVERFFEANELFRGVACREQPRVAAAYAELGERRREVCAALRDSLSEEESPQKDALVYNHLDNDLCFKSSTASSVPARDRRGRSKQGRYTTAALQRALAGYCAATRAVDREVQAILRELCEEVAPHLPHVRVAISAAQLLVASHQHASQAMGRGWSLLDAVEGDFRAEVAPYWLQTEAVHSRVRLDGRGAIATGPNMSGKSTLMRSIGAAALLVNCGLFSPCRGAVPRYRQICFLVAEGDRPAEGVSAFGQEALIGASLLRRACGGTLALVDEFGRGTEPASAQAAVGALVEELAERGAQFVVATHMHGVTDLPLRLPGGCRPACWHMGVVGAGADGGDPRWTYRLEEGVCRESYAWHTLRRFGWPDAAVRRFHRLVGAGCARGAAAGAEAAEAAEGAADAAGGGGSSESAGGGPGVGEQEPRTSVSTIPPESLMAQ